MRLAYFVHFQFFINLIYAFLNCDARGKDGYLSRFSFQLNIC